MRFLRLVTIFSLLLLIGLLSVPVHSGELIPKSEKFALDIEIVGEDFKTLKDIVLDIQVTAARTKAPPNICTFIERGPSESEPRTALKNQLRYRLTCGDLTTELLRAPLAQVASATTIVVPNEGFRFSQRLEELRPADPSVFREIEAAFSRGEACEVQAFIRLVPDQEEPGSPYLLSKRIQISR